VTSKNNAPKGFGKKAVVPLSQRYKKSGIMPDLGMLLREKIGSEEFRIGAGMSTALGGNDKVLGPTVTIAFHEGIRAIQDPRIFDLLFQHFSIRETPIATLFGFLEVFDSPKDFKEAFLSQGVMARLAPEEQYLSSVVGDDWVLPIKVTGSV